MDAVGYYVLAELQQQKEAENGGFLLPEEVMAEYKKAKVLSVGDLVEENINKDDIILVTGDYKRLRYDGRDLIVLKAEDVTIKI